jgi:hypothetical protein
VPLGVLLLAAGVWWGVSAHSRKAPVTPPAPVPRAPARLLATGRASGDVELCWGHPASEVTGFTIERATDGRFIQNRRVVATTAGDVTRHLDTTLAIGVTYCYRARATGPGGASDWSNTAWPVPGYGGGFAPAGLTLNGGAALAGTALRLTDGRPRLATSAFYSTPVDVRSFTTTFRFRIGRGRELADGFTFCLQGNDPTRVGVGAGGLGYENIAKSVAVKFDLWNIAGEGTNSTGLYANGARPYEAGSIDLTPSGIDLHSGRIYRARLAYGGGKLALKVLDEQDKRRAFRRTFAVDVPAAVGGDFAYAGFTAGSGGRGAVEDILDWTWGLGPTRDE